MFWIKPREGLIKEEEKSKEQAAQSLILLRRWLNLIDHTDNHLICEIFKHNS